MLFEKLLQMSKLLKFIQAHDDIWHVCFNRKFEIMSDKMVEDSWKMVFVRDSSSSLS